MPEKKANAFWTPEALQKAAQFWNDGLSAAQVAFRMGVSRNSIIGLTHRHTHLFHPKRKVVRPNSQLAMQPHLLQRASEAWARGLTMSTIADITGCSLAVVRAARNANPNLFPARSVGAPEKKQDSITTIRKPSARAAGLGLHAHRANPSAGVSRRFHHRDATFSGATPVAFVDVRAGQCRWPLVDFDDASGPDMPCCGRSTGEGKTYCSEHLKISAGGTHG